jgi:hypothetical protein
MNDIVMSVVTSKTGKVGWLNANAINCDGLDGTFIPLRDPYAGNSDIRLVSIEKNPLNANYRKTFWLCWTPSEWIV